MRGSGRRAQKGRNTRKRGCARTAAAAAATPPRATQRARGHAQQRGVRVCVVACAHHLFRLLVRSALTQQRHDGSVAEHCGKVQRRGATLRA
jgi:hypothetical protein